MSSQLIETSEVIWRLRMLRMWSDKTVRDVAAAAPIGRSTLSNIEQVGTRNIEHLRKLCAYYSRFASTEVRVLDLLDPDFDTRVWLNAAA